MAAKDPACDGCWYYRRCGTLWTCDYLLLTGHPRPCGPGPECTQKVQWKEELPVRKSTWDKSKGYRMWTEGASDAEIGRACGAATSTVRFCRLKHWEGKPGFVMERAEDALSGGTRHES